MKMPRNTRMRYPGGRTSLWGVVAYPLGYLATYALLAPSLQSLLSRVVVAREYSGVVTLADVAADAPLTTWHVVGVAFYNAHLVGASLSIPDGGVTSVNLLLSVGGPYTGLLVVPPIVLTLAGVAATRGAPEATALQFDLGDWAWRRYAINGGLSATLGYLPFALVGAVTIAIGGPLAPHLLPAWVLAGLVYPFVFGGLGGVLAWKLRSR